MSRTRLAGRLLWLVLMVGGATAAPAAAGERVRVEWSSAEPSQQWAPRVNVELPAKFGSPLELLWAGPCATPGNCWGFAQDFRWQEAEYNSAGHPRVISLIDDAPQQRRAVCVVVEHSHGVGWPTGGTIQGTLVLTDVDGTTRSIPFAVDKGQKTAKECSPQTVAGPLAGPFTLDPPRWWRQARAVLKARGGKCSRTRHEEPKEGGTWAFDVLECRSKIPKAVVVAHGGNPQAPSFFESCTGSASQGRPNGDDWGYSCDLFASPGTRAKPNPKTWVCSRWNGFSPGYGRHDGPWKADGLHTPWPNRRLKRLADCLAPRGAMRLTSRPASSGTLLLPAICSRACTAEVTAIHNGRLVGTGRRTLPAWRKRSIRLDLPRHARGAARLALRLSVKSGKWRGRGTTTAKVTGGSRYAAKAADAILRK